MTSYIQNTPRNPLMGALADNLAKAKRYGNKYEVKDWIPLIGGTGLGDMFMQEAPELADDVSYYGPSALISGHYGRIPTPDKRILDAAMLGLDAAGLAKLSGAAGKAGLRKMFSYSDDIPVSESRRELLKRGAALGGAAAVGLPLLYAGRKAAKEATEPLAKVVKPPQHRYNSLAEYNDDLENIVWDINADRQWNSAYHPNKPIDDGFPLKFDDIKAELANRDLAEYKRQKALEANYGRSSNIPEGESWRIAADDGVLDAFSPQAKAEMKAFKEWNTYGDNVNWPAIDRFIANQNMPGVLGR